MGDAAAFGVEAGEENPVAGGADGGEHGGAGAAADAVDLGEDEVAEGEGLGGAEADVEDGDLFGCHCCEGSDEGAGRWGDGWGYVGRGCGLSWCEMGLVR